MATTYKVLGQTSATAAAATENLNLVKDPSFDGTTLGVNDLGQENLTTSFYSLSSIGLPLWHWRSDQSNYAKVAEGKYSSSNVTAQIGSKSIGVYSVQNCSGYSFYFKYAGGSTTTGSTDMQRIDTSLAMPVSPSTSYYYGAWFYGTSAVGPSAYMTVQWYNSSGTYISDNTMYITKTNNTWVRNTATVTSPATAAYANFYLGAYFSTTSNGNYFFWDGIHFSSVSSTNTTFPNPYTGSNLTLDAPFTSRLSTGWNGTANNSTTVNSYAGTPVDLYTVPGATQTVVSTISVSNLSTSATTYRIAVVPSGETLAKKHWIAFDAPIAANSTDTLTLGVTLNAGDKIKVASDTANVSFSAFGSEIA